MIETTDIRRPDTHEPPPASTAVQANAEKMAELIAKLEESMRMRDALLSQLRMWIEFERQGISHKDIVKAIPCFKDTLTYPQRQWFKANGINVWVKTGADEALGYFGSVELTDGKVYPLAVPIRQPMRAE